MNPSIKAALSAVDAVFASATSPRSWWFNRALTDFACVTDPVDGEIVIDGRRFTAERVPEPVLPGDPDYSRPGIFAAHNCSGCGDGARACREGNSNNCSWPRARND